MAARYLKFPHAILRNRNLKPSDKLVLQALLYWGWRSKECYPGESNIAKESSLTTRTIRTSLDRLEKCGFIKEVPDNNPTHRKFLLLWMDDPEYADIYGALRKSRVAKRTADGPAAIPSVPVAADNWYPGKPGDHTMIQERGWVKRAILESQTNDPNFEITCENVKKMIRKKLEKTRKYYDQSTRESLSDSAEEVVDSMTMTAPTSEL